MLHLLAVWLPSGPPAIGDRLLLIAWLAALAALAFGYERLARPAAIGALAVMALAVLLLEPLATLAATLAGFVLVERIYRQADLDRRWSLKLMLIGVSMVLAADLVLIMERLLVSAVPPGLLGARALAQALCVPLVAASIARNPSWSLDIHIGRRAVFGGIVLAGSTIYVLLALVAGLLARDAIGPGSQTALVIVLLGGLALVLTSGRARATLTAFVSQTFFTYRFDYRDEWARFVRTLQGDSVHGAQTLAERVIFAVADLVDSTGGAIWQLERGDRLRLVAVRNLPLQGSRQGAAKPLIAELRDRAGVVDMDDPKSALAGRLPSWFPTPAHAWIVMPLHHRGRLFGLLTLARRRTRRGLDGEEKELLNVVAHEAASYLAEDAAAAASARRGGSRASTGASPSSCTTSRTSPRSSP